MNKRLKTVISDMRTISRRLNRPNRLRSEPVNTPKNSDDILASFPHKRVTRKNLKAFDSFLDVAKPGEVTDIQMRDALDLTLDEIESFLSSNVGRSRHKK